MRLWSVGLSALAVVACAKPPPPPTNEEAAQALADMKNGELSDALLRALQSFDAGPDEDAGVSSPAPKTPSAGTSRRRPDATVDAMKCDRVDKTTHDCHVQWRLRRETNEGVYRFTRGADEKWQARPR